MDSFKEGALFIFDQNWRNVARLRVKITVTRKIYFPPSLTVHVQCKCITCLHTHTYPFYT
jgi:hypothetical protein